MKVVSLLLRGLEFFFTLLIIALVGNIIADAKSGNPSIINYCIFIAVFSMLSLVYLILGTVNESLSGNPVFMVGVDAINTLLFFCGGAALAAQLDVHSCGNKVCAYPSPSSLSHADLLVRRRVIQTAIP